MTADATPIAADKSKMRVKAMNEPGPFAMGTTDAEGKFTMKAPRKGEYVIAAEGWRLMLGGETETYYWLQPISLNGQDQVVQNLSNTNLGGAVGISLLLGTAK